MNQKLIKIFLTVVFAHAVTNVGASGARFITEGDRVLDEGHMKLEWEAKEDMKYEIQQASKHDFSDAMTIYKGPDEASFISGLTNGVYYYRIREVGGEWSDELTVEVKHHSLTVAFTLFGFGAVVFILTTLVVLRGYAKFKEAA